VRPPIIRTYVRATGSAVTDAELRLAIGASNSWAGTLRRLGYRSAGGNWKTLQKYAAKWDINTEHFDSAAASLAGFRRHQLKPRSLSEVMVENSGYGRSDLKRRLFAAGLKKRECELCGQGETWRGGRMALILDHINGVANDHRVENLRIVCPNCAATFATHCGRKNRRPPRTCALCGAEFAAKRSEQKYCSRDCGRRVGARAGLERRKVERPPYEQLMREIAETSYLAVGRKYGVSDNAIRKWVRFYENGNELRSTE